MKSGLHFGMDHILALQVTKTQTTPINPIFNIGPAGMQEPARECFCCKF